MLSQLVYVSNRKPNCTNDEIEKILESCKRNNSDLNITGVLLYSDKKFIQYLEGESKEIYNLYEKIKEDDRHKNAMMISYGPINKKIFPTWHMANKSVNQNEVNFRTDITAEDKKLFQNILNGEEEKGSKVMDLLSKFFK